MKKNNNIVLLIVVLILILLGIYYFSNMSVAPVQDIREDITENQSEVTTSPVVSPVESEPVVTKSDAPKATITVVTPNGGEEVKIRNSSTISWKQTGLNAANTVKVGFRDENFNVCWAGNVGATLGKMTFIPQEVECAAGSTLTNLRIDNKYKVQLQVNEYNTGMGVADYSDNFFTIAR